jgi:hypothetical protein
MCCEFSFCEFNTKPKRQYSVVDGLLKLTMRTSFDLKIKSRHTHLTLIDNLKIKIKLFHEF